MLTILLLLFCNNQLFPMEWIKEHPKIAMSAIVFAGMSYFIKDQFLCFVKKLINPNKTDTNGSQDSALHKACDNNDIDEVRFLLSLPHIDPNIQNIKGNTPLHNACSCYQLNPEIVKLLLNHKTIEPDIWNFHQEPPLYTIYTRYAEKNDCLANEIIKLFIKHPKTYLNYSYKNSLLSYACSEGWTDIVKMALEREDIAGNFYIYLSRAHHYHHKEIFEMLRNHSQTDPADLFYIALETENEDIIEELLQKYSLNSLKTKKSKSMFDPCTAACIAARIGNVKICTLILNQQNIYVNESLHIAIECGHIAIVQLLLKQKGINIHERNHKKESFFWSAIKKITKILL